MHLPAVDWSDSRTKPSPPTKHSWPHALALTLAGSTTHRHQLTATNPQPCCCPPAQAPPSTPPTLTPLSLNPKPCCCPPAQAPPSTPMSPTPPPPTPAWRQVAGPPTSRAGRPSTTPRAARACWGTWTLPFWGPMLVSERGAGLLSMCCPVLCGGASLPGVMCTGLPGVVCTGLPGVVCTVVDPARRCLHPPLLRPCHLILPVAGSSSPAAGFSGRLVGIHCCCLPHPLQSACSSAGTLWACDAAISPTPTLILPPHPHPLQSACSSAGTWATVWTCATS